MEKERSARDRGTNGVSQSFTELLAAARRGESGAVDRLLPLVYDRLRLLAHRQLRLRRRPGQSIDTTDLVHEAYLKLVDRGQVDWQDRNHFLCLAAVAMRHILVDYARSRTARKRGGDARRTTLTDAAVVADQRAVEILDLDRALSSLAEHDARRGRIVELRFFGGLTVEETAAALYVSERTIKREWRKARAYLYRELDPAGSIVEGPPE